MNFSKEKSKLINDILGFSRDEIIALLDYLPDFDLTSPLIKHVIDLDENTARKLAYHAALVTAAVPDTEQEPMIDISERSSPRYPVSLEVTITSSNNTMHEKSGDISETGMFVKTSRNFSLNEKVTLTLSFSSRNQEEILSFDSSVARLNKDGIGVRFKDIAPEKKAALQAFIAGL